jgi:hypothetical protein
MKFGRWRQISRRRGTALLRSHSPEGVTHRSM